MWLASDSFERKGSSRRLNVASPSPFLCSRSAAAGAACSGASDDSASILDRNPYQPPGCFAQRCLANSTVFVVVFVFIFVVTVATKKNTTQHNTIPIRPSKKVLSQQSVSVPIPQRRKNADQGGGRWRGSEQQQQRPHLAWLAVREEDTHTTSNQQPEPAWAIERKVGTGGSRKPTRASHPDEMDFSEPKLPSAFLPGECDGCFAEGGGRHSPNLQHACSPPRQAIEANLGPRGQNMVVYPGPWPLRLRLRLRTIAMMRLMIDKTDVGMCAAKDSFEMHKANVN